MTAVLGILGLLALGFFPGAAIVSWVNPRVGPAARTGLALALSPAIAGSLTALLVGAGTQWSAAYWTLLGISLAVTAAAWARSRGAVLGGGEPAEATRTALIAAGLAILVTAPFPIFSEWWRVSSDAWAHAPIVRAFLDEGLPPYDPWYAGFRLGYAWIYHASIAAGSSATGLDPFSCMAVLAVLSFVSVVLSLVPLLQRMHDRHPGWALAFVVLGFNCLFTLFIPLIAAKALLGQSRGTEELARAFDLLPFNYDTSTVFVRAHGGQSWFLDKFLVATPLSLALAAFIAWAGCFWRHLQGSLRTPRTATWRDLCLAAHLTLCAAVLHPVVGLTLLVTTLFLGALVLLRFLHGPSVRGSMWSWVIAVVLGFLPAAPFVVGLMGGSGDHSRFPLDLSPQKLWGLFGCLLPGLLVAVWAGPRFGKKETSARIWLWWVAGCALVALFVRLPGPSSYFTVDKLSYLVWIPLALAVSGWVGDWFGARSTAAKIALALLLFAPVSGFLWISRAVDYRVSWRQPWDIPAHATLRSGLPGNTVLIVPPGDIDTSNFLRRDLYHVEKPDAMLRGYPVHEMKRREEIVQRLYRAGTLSADDQTHLEKLGRPIFAVWPNLDAIPWRERSPGWRNLLLPTRGVDPPWGGGLPVQKIGNAYVVTPLTENARAVFPFPNP